MVTLSVHLQNLTTEPSHINTEKHIKLLLFSILSDPFLKQQDGL